MAAVIPTLGGPELIIIAVVLVVLFGGRKIPELMRGIGQGFREIRNIGGEAEDAAKELQKKG